MLRMPGQLSTIVPRVTRTVTGWYGTSYALNTSSDSSRPHKMFPDGMIDAARSAVRSNDDFQATARNVTRSAYSVLSWSTTGNSRWHDGHHSAQKTM